MMPKSINKSDCYFIGLIVILFLFLLIVVSPLGEFPLNDDWVHSLIIRNYLETNNFYYIPWLSSNLHVPIGYGIILTKIFGFSFALLRLSNLVFACSSIIIFYCLLRILKISSKTSLLFSLLLWFNPLTFNLAYSFMGDIISLFLLLAAFYFYYLGFYKDKAWALLIANLVTVLGFFTRQTAIILFIASIIIFFTQVKRRKLAFLWVYGIPIFILILIYSLLFNWHLLPGQIGARFLSDSSSYVSIILTNLWSYFLLLNLFVLPATLGLFLKNKNWFKEKALLFFLILSIPFGIWAFFSNNTFPNLGNIINLYGLGPSVTVMQGNAEIWGSLIIYQVVNILILFIAACNFLIIHKFIKANWNNIINSKYNLFFLYGILYLLLILPIKSFDRYLLLLLPVILLLFALILEHWSYSKPTFIIFLILFSLYSIIGTHNYLAWNQARWQLGQKLVNQGIDAKNIEGGYEFDGWYLYLVTQKQKIGDYIVPWAPWYVKQLYPGHLMKYIISFSPLGGYEVIDQQKVNGWFSNFEYIYINEVGVKI